MLRRDFLTVLGAFVGSLEPVSLLDGRVDVPFLEEIVNTNDAILHLSTKETIAAADYTGGVFTLDPPQMEFSITMTDPLPSMDEVEFSCEGDGEKIQGKGIITQYSTDGSFHSYDIFVTKQYPLT